MSQAVTKMRGKLRIAAEGDRVVVRDGRGAWRPETGQALFDFGVASISERVAPLLREAQHARDERGLDAQDWYAWGSDLEDGAPEQARRAYAAALRLDPDHPGANLNLGRLLHAGRATAAPQPPPARTGRHQRQCCFPRCRRGR